MIELFPNIFYIPNLIFRTYADFPDLMRWFEMVHIEKHLKRLKTLGKVQRIHDMWSAN
ncbi:MAG: hypothetical protein PVG06_20690 [Desulfobacterales bacterium]|jgi:hypothetical protein